MHLLQHTLPAAVFDRDVLVIGTQHLDGLSKSRTLPSLVWCEMEPAVTAHESVLTCLQDAITRVVLVLALGKRGIGMPARVLINDFGDFTGDLADIHRRAAVGWTWCSYE